MKKLEINDYELLKPYFINNYVEASELTFTNIFMWRIKYNFHYEIVNDYLYFIDINDDGECHYSQPVGNYNNTKELINSVITLKNNSDLIGKPFIVKKTDTSFIKILDDAGILYSISRDLGTFDYIYDFNELSNLSGNKYHKKKNHINKFLKTYSNWKYEKLSLDNIDAVKAFSDKWFDAAPIEKKETDLDSEQVAINEALSNFQTLCFDGGMIKVNDEVVAFTLGERLNSDTIVIHIEKADTKYDGLYNLINQQFLLNQENNYLYINREQDLGIAGLRKAKLSYHPIKMTEKYNIYL